MVHSRNGGSPGDFLDASQTCIHLAEAVPTADLVTMARKRASGKPVGGKR
jgi:hypothetical protein